MTSSGRDRWWAKANAYASGWVSEFPTLGTPSLGNVVLGLAVAQGETACGDAWPGEHNWGAVQKRPMNDQERAALTQAGIHASADPAALTAARDAISAAIAAGTCPPLDHEALHLDSSPVTGWYFAYYWAFDNDADGAAKFIHVLAGQTARVQCEQELVRAGTSPSELVGGAGRLALYMYQSHYYEGVHNPHEPGGAEANVWDYTHNLTRLAPDILAALSGWSPGKSPPPPGPVDFDLSTTLGVQQALNFLTMASPPLDEDGVDGPRTKQIVMAFQATYHLQVDGVVGPATMAALKSALRI